MNVFDFFVDLYELRKIALQYSASARTLRMIEETQRLIAGHRLRTAIIGDAETRPYELLNAFIGSQALPPDVFARVSFPYRVVLDENQGVAVCYSQGETKRCALNELRDFLAQQSTAPHEEIQEIEVHYPSACPEQTLELTVLPLSRQAESSTPPWEDALANIQMVIVMLPLFSSLNATYQEEIQAIICQSSINHCFFVPVFDGETTVQETSQAAQALRLFLQDALDPIVLSGADEDTVAKAQYFLCDPVVLPVNAAMALEAFLRNDRALLQRSRFAEFKSQWLSVLLTSRYDDMYTATWNCVTAAYHGLPTWYDAQCETLQDRCATLNAQLNRLERAGDFQWRQERMLAMEQALAPERKRLRETIATLKQSMRKCFIHELSQLRSDTISEPVIQEALRSGMQSASLLTDGVADPFYEKCYVEMDTCIAGCESMLTAAGLTTPDLPQKHDQWRHGNATPAFAWKEDWPADLMHANLQEIIWRMIDQSLDAWQATGENWLANWRSMIFRALREGFGAEAQALTRQCQEELHACEQSAVAAEQCYELHREQINEIMGKWQDSNATGQHRPG